GGVAIPGATAASHNLQYMAASEGTRSLELRVTDNSPFVKPEMAGTDMVHSRFWTLEVAVPLSLSISDASITEGNSGARLANFTINLSGPAPASGVSFNVGTTKIGATGNAAVAGTDFAAWQQVGKTIPAGQSSTTFSVKILGDKITEPNEVFAVRLSNPLAATLADDYAVGTIVNDDSSHLRGSSIGSGIGASPTKPSLECQRLQKAITDIEAKVAAKRQNETDGVQGILRLEGKRAQLGCH
ncbi:MAG: hypothetical protein ACREO2_12125, partial [Arenimonas sp.]